MKPCVDCRHLTGALAWMTRKGAPKRWIPFCPACLEKLEDEPTPAPNNLNSEPV